MTDINQTSSNRIVHKYINDDYDEDDNCIPNVCSQELSQACNTGLEWVVRIPHVFPFTDLQETKDKFGLLKYQEALMLCVSEVGLNLLQDRRVEHSPCMEVSFVVRAICDITETWLLGKEREDQDFFDFVHRSHHHFYKVMTFNERKKLERYMNEFSLILRKELMNSGFREKVHSFKKNAKKRYKQIMDVAAQAWSIYSSILVIRLDSGYKRSIPDLRGYFATNDDYVERFKKVSEYRLKMLNVLRKMYGQDLCFFAWKIECTSVKGLHIHWFIGLNGARYQDRINVPKAIVQKWDALKLNEDFYTWNLNAMQRHDDAILRVIDYSDPMLWRIVGGYADYLTKVDYLVRHRTPKGMHSFGATNLSTSKAKTKRGPKRRKAMAKLDIWAVRRPLSELNAQTNTKGNE